MVCAHVITEARSTAETATGNVPRQWGLRRAFGAMYAGNVGHVTKKIITNEFLSTMIGKSIKKLRRHAKFHVLSIKTSNVASV